MKKLFIILSCLSSFTLLAQNVEFFAGPTKNMFYDFKERSPHNDASYKSGYGYSLGLAIEDVKIDWMVLRFTLRYDQYSGSTNSYNAVGTASYTQDLDFDKSILSFGVFPINRKLFNTIDWNLGIEAARLLSESSTGSWSNTQAEQPNQSGEVSKDLRFNAKSYFGLTTRFAYDLPINEHLSITPQYIFNFGLSNEFGSAKSVRHFLGIGIKKHL